MFEDGLHGLIVAAQQHHVLVEGLDTADQLDAIHQENGNRDVFLAQGIEKLILQIQTFFVAHAIFVTHLCLER